MSQNGNVIALGFNTNTPVILDSRVHYKKHMRLDGNGSMTNAVKLQKEALLALTANSDGCVKLWDLAQ